MSRPHYSKSPPKHKFSGLLNEADPLNETERVVRTWIRDLHASILVGPPMFPLRRLTGKALFDLALEKLDKHDMPMADALRLYSGRYARLEELGLAAATFRKPSVESLVAWIKFLLTEPERGLIDELRIKFDKFRQEVGKQSCSTETIQRQDKLLRGYFYKNSYPAGTIVLRDQRSAWIYKHLPAMIARVQGVTCWHAYPDMTKQDFDDFATESNDKPSAAKLRALILARLHKLSAGYISKRLLPRRRQ